MSAAAKLVQAVAEPLAKETRGGFAVLLTALVGIGDLLAAQQPTTPAADEWDALRVSLLNEADHMKEAAQ